MSTGDEAPTLCLAVRCAACHQPPPLRITRTMARALGELPASEVVGSFTCQTSTGPSGGRCGAVVPLRADAYQRAFAAPSRPVPEPGEVFTRLVGPHSTRSVRSRGIR